MDISSISIFIPDACRYEKCFYCAFPLVNCPNCFVNDVVQKKKGCYVCFETLKTKQYMYKKKKNITDELKSYSVFERTMNIYGLWFINQNPTYSKTMKEYMSNLVKLNEVSSKIKQLEKKINDTKNLYITLEINEIYNSSKSIIKLVEDTFYPVENLNETNNVDVNININIQEHSIIQNAHIQLDDIKKKHLQKMNTINENHLTDYNQKIVSIQEDIKILQLEFNKYKGYYDNSLIEKNKIYELVNTSFKNIVCELNVFITKQPVNDDYIKKLCTIIPDNNGVDIPCYWREFIYHITLNRIRDVLNSQFNCKNKTLQNQDNIHQLPEYIFTMPLPD